VFGRKISRFSVAIISNNLSQQFLDIYVKSKIGKRKKYQVFVLFLTSKSYFYSVEKNDASAKISTRKISIVEIASLGTPGVT
jgi:hypothetical protein